MSAVSKFSPDEEYTYILYNSSYGGFSLSEEAKELYNQKSPEKKMKLKNDKEEKEYIYDWEIERHDPILISVFEELGTEKCSGSYCKLKIARIPKKHEEYYTISEYDGLESITVNKHTYLLDQIRKIANIEEKSSDEKINEICEVLKE